MNEKTNLLGAPLFILWLSVTTAGAQRTDSSYKSLTNAYYLEHKFHYLNVAVLDEMKAHDEFDCGLACLKTPSCFSVNLAASSGKGEKLPCELLSSDKYNNSEEFKENSSWHHFSIWSPCSMDLCSNGGTCVANYENDLYECLCGLDFSGKHCEEEVIHLICNETEGWKIYTSHCYKFFPQEKSWLQAEDYCKQLNANLVTIHSKEENYVVVTQIMPLYNDSEGNDVEAWIGASDSKREGKWVWVDGEDFSGYKNWQDKEPNDGNGGQDCALIWNDQELWYDESCSSTAAFICKKSATEVKK